MRVVSVFRDMAQTGVVLGILGFPQPAECGYSVEAHAVAMGEGIEKYFSWTMSGDLAMLQERGGIIGLNTLRLALLEKEK